MFIYCLYIQMSITKLRAIRFLKVKPIFYIYLYIDRDVYILLLSIIYREGSKKNNRKETDTS
jgi:hypothetical protein